MSNAAAVDPDQESKDRFITEVYDEVKDFPPVVDGKRTASRKVVLPPATLVAASSAI